MILEELKGYLAEDLARVQEIMEDSLKSDIGLLNVTNASILSNEGKMIRPILSLLVARTCSGGAVTRDGLAFAAASELLHNATLLHDDVADDSSCRRGRPTVKALLGGRASVLLGDYWLVKAMDNILSSRADSDKMIRVFAKTLRDLAEGEMLQLEKASSADTGMEDYLRIIYCKTASLFEASAVSAACSAGAPEEMTASAAAFARELGIAFQMEDDILDYLGSPSLGKPFGADLAEGKITLPLLEALGTASEEEAAEVRALVAGIPSNPDNLQEVRDFVFRQGGIASARATLDNQVGKALGLLRRLPENRDRDYLEQLTLFISRRNS